MKNNDNDTKETKWGILNLVTGFVKAIPETDKDYEDCKAKGLTKSQASQRAWEENQREITHQRSIMEQENID